MKHGKNTAISDFAKKQLQRQSNRKLLAKNNRSFLEEM